MNRLANRRSINRQEEGQVLIIVALAMIALMLLLALTVDIGIGYAERRSLQNAADAAAEAGTRELILYANSRGNADSHVQSAINQYASANGATLDYTNDPPYYVDSSGSLICPVGRYSNIPDNAVGVQVHTAHVLNTFFARALGRDTMDIAAVSDCVATCAEMPGSMGNLIPISVPKQEFTAGGTYVLLDPQYWKDYGYENLDAHFKGILNLNNEKNNPPTISNWTRYGYPGSVDIGSYVNIDNGDLGSHVPGALKDRFDDGYEVDSNGDYILVMIPVWDQYHSGHGNDDTVHISGFAQMKIYKNDIGANTVKGTFVSYIVPGGIPATTGGNCTSWGPKYARFVPPGTGMPTYPASNTPTPMPTSTPTPAGTPGSTPTPTATPTPVCPDPTISGITVSGSGNSVTVSWTTNTPTTSSLAWNTQSGGDSGSTSGSGLSTSHSLTASHLSNNVICNYTITSMDSCGQTVTETGTFSR